MSAKPMTEEMRPRLRQKGRSLNNNPWEPEMHLNSQVKYPQLQMTQESWLLLWVTQVTACNSQSKASTQSTASAQSARKDLMEGDSIMVSGGTNDLFWGSPKDFFVGGINDLFWGHQWFVGGHQGTNDLSLGAPMTFFGRHQ